MNDHNEKEMWKLAKRRANFRRSLIVYILVNSFLWCIWLITSGPNSYPWPVWPMLGWGLRLAMQYISAYHGGDLFSATGEYERLKRERAGNEKV